MVLTRSPARASRCGSADQSRRLHRGAEALAQRLRAIERAIDHVDARKAALDQAIDHGARRAAGAEHHRLLLPAIPARHRGVEIVGEAFDVGVGGEQPAAIEPKVLAAPTARARSSGSEAASAASLCGSVTLQPT